MASRLEVQAILSAVPGVAKAYYQPPESVALEYPAIIYSKAKIKTTYADNKLYHKKLQYNLTIIAHDPDNTIGAYIMENYNASFVRPYNSNGLYHEKYDVYL